MKITFPPDERSISFEVYPYWLTVCLMPPKFWWIGKEGPSQNYDWRFGFGIGCIGKHWVTKE